MDKELRILLLADYKAGLNIAEFLHSENEHIVGLVTPPRNTRNYLNTGFPTKIRRVLNLPSTQIYRGEDLSEQSTLEKIKSLKPDIAFSIFWGSLLKKDFFEIFPEGCINLHLSYLPYNRGRNPNIWPIIDQTPAGVTMHYIDETADTGDIISQQTVTIESFDTGKTLYKKLTDQSIELFKNTWPEIKNGSVSRKQQDSKFPAHTNKNLATIQEIKLDQTYLAQHIIDIIRALSFSPFTSSSAYFRDEQGKKIFMNIQLTPE